MPSVAGDPLLARLGRLAPGIPDLIGYRPGDLPNDLLAGLSVAAVAFPVGVAYAQLGSFDPVVGLYSSIIALGQAGKLLGFELEARGILRRLLEILDRFGETH